MDESPYHQGEIYVQQKLDERAPAERNGRIISHSLLAGAVKFIENSSFVIVSSQDSGDRIWTSVLSGQKGYLKVKDEKTILLNQTHICSNFRDCFWQNIERHPYVGMLFIELTTHRRYRVNGLVNEESGKVVIYVKQAYANCPKYIQRRSLTVDSKSNYEMEAIRGTTLPLELIQLIKKADTFFVGSSNGQGDMDASHRGGNKGFIEVISPSLIRIPDYEGNSMYNTLGNFTINPKAGLLFIDFEKGRSLQLTGKVEMNWPDKSLLPQEQGKGRFWTFLLEEWVLLENLKGSKWTFIDYSPFNP